MNKGFTLVELLVVVGIIALLTAITLPYYRAGERQYALQESAHKLVQDIRRIQEMAMSARETQIVAPPRTPIGGYGVHFDRYIIAGTTNYKIYLFADLNDNGRYDSGEKVEQIILEKEVRVKDIKLNSFSPNEISINFKPPDPITRISGTGVDTAALAIINLALKADSIRTKTISVNRVGLIVVE